MNKEIEAITSALAKLVARDIFQCGDNPGSPAQRMQFMGGKFPDNEKPQGGLCEAAMQEVIARSIHKHLRPDLGINT